MERLVEAVLFEAMSYEQRLAWVAKHGFSIATEGVYPTWSFWYTPAASTVYCVKGIDHSNSDLEAERIGLDTKQAIKGRFIKYAPDFNFIFLYSEIGGKLVDRIPAQVVERIKYYVGRELQQDIGAVVDDHKRLLMEKRDWDLVFQRELFEVVDIAKKPFTVYRVKIEGVGEADTVVEGISEDKAITNVLNRFGTEGILKEGISKNSPLISIQKIDYKIRR